MSSSKFEQSPDSERMDHEQAEEAPTSRLPADEIDPPWRNDRERPPASGSQPPISSAPDSMWSDADDDADGDDVPPETPGPCTPHEEPQSSAEPVVSSGSPQSSMTPESALVHSSGSLHTVRTAAAHMGVKPAALRAQCRNGAGPHGVADLGGGIIAFKYGRFWRIRFPWWQ